MSGTSLRLALSALCVAAFSCAAPADDTETIQIRWGLNGTSALPSDVDQIQLEVCRPATQAELDDPEIETFGGEFCGGSNSCSVGRLTLELEETPSCRPAAGTEMFGSNPVLVRRGLTPGVAYRFRFIGNENISAPGEPENFVPRYVGRFGPLVLNTGERRQPRIQMYPIADAQVSPATDVLRALHTGTYLPDGRVLIAGGFERITARSTCPASLGLDAAANCFDLLASDTAMVFDVASRTLEPIRRRMLAARGGHTATTLPDGRVLLAGGASAAVLAMIPQESGGSSFEIFAQDDEGAPTAYAHFEIFDAFADGEEVDEDRDGDLGRGAFVGGAGGSVPGNLNRPRFMHAAAAVRGTPSRVILAGGIGSDATPSSYEVFDSDRAGGPGVYRNGGSLSVSRRYPGAVGLGDDQVWIFGGAGAMSDADLADVWELDPERPNGSLMPASEAGEFPHTAPSGTDTHPEYALLRPSVAAIDGGQSALVVGWYGARCEVGDSTPVFEVDGVATEFCNGPTTGERRSFTVTASTGVTAPTDVRPHAFGEVVVLQGFRSLADGTPDTRPAYSGGITNTSWTPQSALDIFSGSRDDNGAATPQAGGPQSLATRRFFHTSTAVPGNGVVTVGGMEFANLELDRANLIGDVEVYFGNF